MKLLSVTLVYSIEHEALLYCICQAYDLLIRTESEFNYAISCQKLFKFEAPVSEKYTTNCK